MAERVARRIVRARYAVVVFWVGAGAAVTAALPTIEEAQVGALGDLVPREAVAIEAELRSKELFSAAQPDARGATRPGWHVRRRAGARRSPRDRPSNRGDYPGLRGIGGALPVSNVLGGPPFARERSTTAITYLFFATNVDRAARERLAERFVERRIEPRFDGAWA